MISRLTFALLLTLSAIFCGAAKADPTPSMQIIEAALDDALARSQRQESDTVFSYVRESQHQDGGTSRQRFVPTSFAQGHWQSLDGETDTVEAESDNLNVEVPFVFNGANVSLEQTTLLAETAQHYLFSVNLVASVDTDAALSDAEQQQVQQRLQQFLSAELKVAKQDNRVTGLRIYAPKPFSPSAWVTVDTFDIDVSYKPAWKNGPLVLHSQTQTLQGRYGFFFSLEQHMSIQISDVTLVKPI